MKRDAMTTVAFYTLGCKTNQYETQALLESFEHAGYQTVPFSKHADVFVINTCTVTGEGDRKSMQTVRRIKRLYPGSEVIVTGCLAQRDESLFLDLGVRLVMGTQNRLQTVALFEKALRDGQYLSAVTPPDSTVFEPLSICSRQNRTRAVIKIQDGCNGHCTYCIVPSVRGSVRSRPLSSIMEEARSLALSGYSEAVLTGINLSSYGQDRHDGISLHDVISAVNSIDGLERIRLGSLEPHLITERFISAIGLCDKLCPHFHVALQSGSDSVLTRMGRRYHMDTYLEAVSRIRGAYPQAALTTDIIAGFPGETGEEHQETMRSLDTIGFARLHVFPYSARTGTAAAALPGHLAKAVRERRAREIASLGRMMAQRYHRSFLDTVLPVLFETMNEDGMAAGYTREYIRVEAANAQLGRTLPVWIRGLTTEGLAGETQLG